MKIFLSYRFHDEHFVQEINYLLKKQPEVTSFFYGDDKRTGKFSKQVTNELEACSGFVLFLSERGGVPEDEWLGGTQEDEWSAALAAERRNTMQLLVVTTDGTHDVPPLLEGRDPVVVPIDEPSRSLIIAREIVKRFGCSWVADDGVPAEYLFDYEKTIIDLYAENDGMASARYIEDGAPPRWPRVERDVGNVPNYVPENIIGHFREPNAGIVVDARTDYPTDQGSPEKKDAIESGTPPAIAHQLAFPEAGPRAVLSYPREGRRSLKVGVVVSGGIAPGINSVIAGIVSRHLMYQKWHQEETRRGYQLTLKGYVEGFKGLLRREPSVDLNEAFVRERANLGGSLLGTSRASELLPSTASPREREQAIGDVVNYLKNAVDILYVIGGDGSMRAAHALWTRARSERVPLSVVAVPKTMDNDILWVWQSFGFFSTVEKAREVLVQLATETMSNPRLCIVQLFGSNSGFVVSHAALASGICDLILTPEVEFSVKGISQYIRERLSNRLHPQERLETALQRPYGLIVMAETAIPTDVEEYLDDRDIGLSDAEREAILLFRKNGCRVQGQTPDALRSAALKIVSAVLQRDINADAADDEYWSGFRVFSNEPRHLIRSIPPSATDVIFGHRLGALAVDNAMAGYTDFMVSQWLTEYVLVPLKLVVLGRKRVPSTGFFWKTVIASTGQPEQL